MINLKIPSGYGVVIWFFVIFALILNPDFFEVLKWPSLLLAGLVLLSFICSNVIFSNLIIDYKPAIDGDVDLETLIAIFCLYLGFLGAFSNIYFLMSYISSKGILLSAISGEDLRRDSGESQSFGVQLSYIGWIGVYISIRLYPKFKKVYFKYLTIFGVVGLVILEFLTMNRMRILWLLFLIFFAWKITFSPKKRFYYISGFFMLGIFVVSGVLTNKINADDLVSALESVFDQLTIYLAGGVLYFIDWLSHDFLMATHGIRSLGSLYKIGGFLGLEIDPSLFDFLDFRKIGPEVVTNVATFLYSFYVDFDVFGVVIGIFLYSFFFDFIYVKIINLKIIYMEPVGASIIFCVLMTPFASQHESFVFLMLTLTSLALTFVKK